MSSVLQCVAVCCCSVLQCAHLYMCYVQCLVCCSVLQCVVAVCRSVLTDTCVMYNVYKLTIEISLETFHQSYCNPQREILKSQLALTYTM